LRGAYVVRRPVVNAYLVRERDRRKLRELLWVMVLVLPLAAGLLFDIWVHLQVIRTGYRINELERVLDDMGQRERRLRLEASYLSSPLRIESRAISELGMIEPQPEQLIYVESRP
jgi:cell division protein FtsL